MVYNATEETDLSPKHTFSEIFFGAGFRTRSNRFQAMAHVQQLLECRVISELTSASNPLLRVLTFFLCHSYRLKKAYYTKGSLAETSILGRILGFGVNWVFSAHDPPQKKAVGASRRPYSLSGGSTKSARRLADS
jgi:hypothetical protein